MHDMRAIREAPAVFDSGLKSRGLEPQSGALLALDDARRAAIAELEAVQARRNAASKEIGQAMAAKDAARAEALKAEVAALKDKMTALEAAAKEAEVALKTALDQIPNIPLPDVPHGADEHGNVEYRRHGEKPDMAARGLNGPAKQHFDLGEALGMMDFEAAARLSGARFVVLKQQLARLERALGQFMLDLHVTEHGYTEINPPLMVRDEVMYGTAQLPKFRDDQFISKTQTKLDADEFEVWPTDRSGELRVIFKGPRKSELDLYFRGQFQLDAPQVNANGSLSGIYPIVERGFWLIPTAEVPLTNLVRDLILAEEDLPLRFTALTPSFRAEAGSAGRDTRGMLRQHQFMKVELVSITTPEAAIDEHHRMLACAENVLKKLDLHYRVMTLCTGDMGFASAKTYDIEVWMPGQDTYREISSCSVCGDFQARRMDARFRPRGEKGTRFVHTLNGSGIAVGRALIAVMENYQNGDGTITVPEVLRPYMGGLTTIGAK